MFSSQAPPARVGRFIVLEQLGTGAMGQVHAAFDPKLERKVAIKLLRFPVASDQDDEDRTRLLREAKAMANVSHPNVLTVFEVGEVGDGEVFIAMEYAASGTLREWSQRAERTPDQVLRACLEAGRGLEAAHAAGLVHRDFKPDNVLLTETERVCVADFGLVGVSATERSRRMNADGPVDQTLTHRGAALGTPAYMAPELLAGESGGPAADQFAFCVATWELLFGERPFRGRSIDDIEAAIRKGPPEPARSPAGIPPRVRAAVGSALARGLAPSPARRHPSMTALLEQLEHARAPRSWPRWPLLMLPVLGLGAYALPQLRSEQSSPPCTSSPERMDAVWNDERRAELRAGFESAESRFGSESAQRVTVRLDEYAADWVAQHRETCEATHVYNEQSDAALDLRMRCLDSRLLALGEAVDLLVREPEKTVIRRAHEVVGALPSLGYCEDLDALTRKVGRPVDPELAARVDELGRSLMTARTLRAAGKWEEASHLVNSIQEDVDATGYAPLRARALYALALIGAGPSTHAFERQREILERAAVLAAEARDDYLAAEIWIRLVLVVGYNEGHYHEALKLRPVAEAAVARTGHEPVLAASLLNNVGIVLDELGEHERAQDAFRRSLALRIEHYGENHPRVAASLNNLGDSLRLGGELEAAREQLSRSLAIKRETLGAQHPQVASTAQNLGVVHLALGEFDEAAAMTELALELYGGKESEYPAILTTLAIIDRRRGEPEKAVQRLRVAIGEADARWKRAQVRADAYRELALSLEEVGDLDAARDAAVQACQILAGEDSAPSERAVTQTTLAALHLKMGDLDDARQALQVAEESWKRVESPRPSRVLQTQTVAARLLAAGGDLEAARARLDAALTAARDRVPEGDSTMVQARELMDELDPGG